MKPTVMLKVRITMEGRNEAIHGFPGHLGAGGGSRRGACSGSSRAAAGKYVIVNSHNGDSLLNWLWIDELEQRSDLATAIAEFDEAFAEIAIKAIGS